MRRRLRETVPPRPSAGVTTTHASCTTACPRCGGEPARLIHRLRGELDWIAMKALDKDRSRRYQTARDLATDIQRYLKGEPVEACPPSIAYQLKKLVLRHKATMITASIVVAILVLGTTVSVWQAIQAHAVAPAAADERLVLESVARREVLMREVRLRVELYATDLHQAWLHWLEGHAARCTAMLERQRPLPDQTDLRGFEWFHLWDLVQQSPAVYRGHPAPILAADVSSDDRYLASGDSAGWVKIWDLSTGNEVRSWCSSEREICTVRFAPDGQSLATAGQDALVRLWRVDSWTEIAQLEGHERTVCAVAWSPDSRQLASAARDHTVRIWDAALASQTHLLTEHTDVVRALAWSPDGTVLASAGADAMVRLWDAQTWQPQGSLTDANHGLLAMAISPDGRYLAAGGYNLPVVVYDLVTRTESARLPEAGTAWSLAFAADSRLLAVGRGEGRLELWELTDPPEGVLARACFRPIRGHAAIAHTGTSWPRPTDGLGRGSHDPAAFARGAHRAYRARFPRALPEYPSRARPGGPCRRARDAVPPRPSALGHTDSAYRATRTSRSIPRFRLVEI